MINFICLYHLKGSSEEIAGCYLEPFLKKTYKPELFTLSVQAGINFSRTHHACMMSSPSYQRSLNRLKVMPSKMRDRMMELIANHFFIRNWNDESLTFPEFITPVLQTLSESSETLTARANKIVKLLMKFNLPELGTFNGLHAFISLMIKMDSYQLPFFGGLQILIDNYDEFKEDYEQYSIEWKNTHSIEKKTEYEEVIPFDWSSSVLPAKALMVLKKCSIYALQLVGSGKKNEDLKRINPTAL
jgi:acyl carrier protein phosphodiesterase